MQTPLLLAALLTVAPVSASAERTELRGVWTHPSSWATKAQADAMLRRVEAMNLNAITMLVFYRRGQVAYRTDLAPMLEGVAEGFDPLGYAVEQAHARGIEVHAWFVNGSYGSGNRSGILDERPEWRAMDLAGRRTDWFDLCNPDVRAWQTRLMIDCLRRYNVDSLHFDYIRFPSKNVCVCPVCRENCKRATGVDLDELRYLRLPALGDFDGNPLAEPTTAKVLMQFENGEPALAVNALGKGRTILFNWKVNRWCPLAVAECARRLLASCGVRKADEILILDSEANGPRRWERFTGARDWIAGLGYTAKRITDKHLANLPAGAAVAIHGLYDMPDASAKHLIAYVEAGGCAVFLDGPVFAIRKHESARRLLGFAKQGKYFKGMKEVRATKPVSPLVPDSGRTIDADEEKAKWAQWDRWRKDQVTDLVRRVSQEARKVRPGAMITAAVFRTPDACDRVLQDWPRWHRERLCDYLVPMSYVKTPEELQAMFGWWKEIDPNLERIIPAVGAFQIAEDTSGEARAAEIARQIAVCRRQGAKGVMMFVLKAIDDATADALGKTAFADKAKPYRPPMTER